MDRFNKLLVGVVLAIGLFCVGLVSTGNADDNTVLVLGTKESLVFDAAWDWSKVGYFPELNTDELTVECWVNPSLDPRDGTRPKMDLLSRNWSQPYALWLWDTGTACFNIWVDNPVQQLQITSVAVVPLGQWTHVAGTYSKTTGELNVYVNGVLSGTRGDIPAGKDLVGYTTDLSIGTVAWDAPFYGNFFGLMDEVRISNVARDPDEFLTRDGEYAQGYDDGYADGLAVNNADLLDMLPPGIRKNIEKQQGFAK